MSFATSIIFREPALESFCGIICVAATILIPIACSIIFINGWIRIKKNSEIYWHHRLFYLGILIISTSTLLRIFLKTNDIFTLLSIGEAGAALQAMLCVSASEIINYLISGMLSLSYCISLLILFPKYRKQNIEANQKPSGNPAPPSS